MSLYNATKALVNVISEDESDYPDSSAYRQVMDRLQDVLVELSKADEE